MVEKIVKLYWLEPVSSTFHVKLRKAHVAKNKTLNNFEKHCKKFGVIFSRNYPSVNAIDLNDALTLTILDFST